MRSGFLSVRKVSVLIRGMARMRRNREKDDDDDVAACNDELSNAIPTGLDVIFSRTNEELLLLMLSTKALLPVRSIGMPKMQYVP